jgi:hypothetical protein
LPALSHWTLRVAFDIGHGGYCRLAFDDPATFINHQIADSNLDKGAGGADRRRRTDLSFRQHFAPQNLRPHAFQTAFRGAAFCAKESSRLIQIKFTQLIR